MNNLLQLASSSLSPTLPPFAGEGANVGRRPPKPIDDAGENVLMATFSDLGPPPSPQPSPARGEGANAGLRPPKTINAGKTF
jgi:hypothetical protein